MKNFLKILGVAFLGGAVALTGYKMLLEKPAMVVQESKDSVLQTVKASYTPAVINSSSTPTNFTDAAEKTVHAVVHVKNTAVRTKQDPYSFFFGGNGTRKFQQVGTGSGVIISPDGYIVTNNHVIADATDIEITLNNRKKLKARLIGADKKNDIALLKVDANYELPNLAFGNSDNVKIGEWVLAVGNPYNLTSTVTAGIVSAKGRDLDGNGAQNIDSFIQTDAAVNPGNSGGALVNTRGELVGINTAISSRTGSFIGYSFAVPSNITKKVIDDLLEFGSVQEALIGFAPDFRNTEQIEGVKIQEITDGGGAKKAGLKIGDVITKVNDVKISKFSDLKGQLTAKRPGDRVAVTVLRNGSEVEKVVTLSKREVFFSSTLKTNFKDLTKKEKKKFKIKGGAIIVSTNNKGFIQFKVGEGYVLTKINNKQVVSASQAVELLDQIRNNEFFIEMLSPSGQKERFRF